MPPSRIVELASIINTKTHQVDDYLSTHGLPPLSFEPDEKSQQQTLPDEIQAAQNAILEATNELHAHMLGPMGILREHVVRLSLPDHAFALMPIPLIQSMFLTSSMAPIK